MRVIFLCLIVVLCCLLCFSRDVLFCYMLRSFWCLVLRVCAFTFGCCWCVYCVSCVVSVSCVRLSVLRVRYVVFFFVVSVSLWFGIVCVFASFILNCMSWLLLFVSCSVVVFVCLRCVFVVFLFGFSFVHLARGNQCSHVLLQCGTLS